MLKTFDLRGRDRPLTINGPPGLETLMALVIQMGGRVGYELDARRARARRRRWSVTATGSRRWRSTTAGSRSATCCSRTSDRACSTPRSRARLGLVEGPEFGRVQRGETVRGVTPEQVLGPPRPGRKLVFSGDTTPCEALRVAAHGPTC